MMQTLRFSANQNPASAGCLGIDPSLVKSKRSGFPTEQMVRFGVGPLERNSGSV